MLIFFARNEFYGLEKKTGHLASRTEFVRPRTPVQRSVKFIKNRTVPEKNRDELDP
jgi:hypothetical protein